MPKDWVSVKSEDLTWDDDDAGSNLKPIDDEQSGSGETGAPAADWKTNMYGLMLGVAVDSHTQMQEYKCVSLQSYNNSHSQTITIADPHHKSLNSIALAQNISWTRSGSYIDMTNRSGRTELRKIGAQGGAITFGGVELKGDYSNQKKLLNIYQREGTPVYLDVQRARDSGEYIRFYGILTNMSEDYPTGLQTAKFGLTMQIEYVCEYDRNTNTEHLSNWIGEGLMSLGGELIDVTTFAP